MGKPRLRPWIAGVLGLTLTVGTSGCSILAPIFLYHYFNDPRLPPDYELREGDEEKSVRVMVLTYSPDSLRAEFAGLDRDLNDRVSRLLFKGLAADKKKIDVIRADVVKKWIDDHPDWKSMEAHEIGAALNADVVICLQIDEFRLFQDPTTRNVLQGRCDMTIRVVPVGPEGAAHGVENLDFSLELPKGNGMPVGESKQSLRQFREWFLTKLAERVTWKFLPHKRGKRIRPRFVLSTQRKQVLLSSRAPPECQPVHRRSAGVQ